MDHYESVVLLGNDINITAEKLAQETQKALKSSNPLPVITVKDTQVSITYPDFSLTLKLITDKDAVDRNKVMAQYFGTERGDLDKIEQVQSYLDIRSKGTGAYTKYADDYAQILENLKALGQTWALNPDGYLA